MIALKLPGLAQTIDIIDKVDLFAYLRDNLTIDLRFRTSSSGYGNDTDLVLTANLNLINPETDKSETITSGYATINI